MVPSLINHTNSSNPISQIKINPSIQTAIDEFHKENPKLSHLIHQFYHSMQSRVDPTPESIWVYAALTFRSRNHPKGDIFDRVSAAKDLFQLLCSCIAPCTAAKGAALLAPVVRLVHDVVLDLPKNDLGVKKEKKAWKEVKNLVGVILGFVNVCCSSNGLGEVEHLGWSSSGLSCVWLDRNESVGKLLPLVSEGVIGELSERDGDVSYLAGVVIAEVFLLRMCLTCKGGGSREELEAELRSWAVGSMTGFQNVYVFEVLLRMLLEKTLPVTSLVSSDDEVLLRKVLYDAIILVEYSFLNPEKAIHISSEQMKIIAMRRLVLAHEAVEYFREHGDQRRSISYTSAFSSSQLYTQIVRWVKSQIPVEDSSVKSKGSSPKALIKLLLNLERQGFLVFGDSILKYHSLDMSKPPASKLDSDGVDDDPFFYIDNKGQGEPTDDGKVNEYISAAFLAAANTMTSTEKRGRKRKGEDSESEEESSLSDEDSE
ncbi:uncharacterized protein LOC126792148 [Argentina anserina]|uniref:uncharacterized protein LOC126792148 n=1 Tax=Argentina anserina TaxID=57926 RepID=UPI002176824B|nr:uncharacterized protein LOC126792148 [Potentilla anserina]